MIVNGAGQNGLRLLAVRKSRSFGWIRRELSIELVSVFRF
jgi:hypothetical protein